MENVRDKVAVIGMGVPRTGELWDKSYDDMLVDAVSEALQAAGLEMKDIQAGFLGTQYNNVSVTALNKALKCGYLPTTQVVNACATGGDTFRVATTFVAAGIYDIVLVAGVDKMKDNGTTGIGGGEGTRTTQIQAGGPPPSNFALYAVRYAHHYGYSMSEVKETLARIAVKNHRNGALNPKAAFQKAITLQQALEAPLVAWPLGLYDCCANVDGAAAAIICRADLAPHIIDTYALVRGVGLMCGDHGGHAAQTHDFVHFEENVRASQLAYAMAGIASPAKELSSAQVHDAFTVNEMVCYEDMGFCPRGAAPRFVKDGFFELEGDLPVNTDGGLKCFGHPVGATGLKMMYEPYLQLTGRAGPRQLRNPRLVLTHNQGGTLSSYASVVHIFSARD